MVVVVVKQEKRERMQNVKCQKKQNQKADGFPPHPNLLSFKRRAVCLFFLNSQRGGI